MAKEQRKNLGRLHNVLVFYQLFAEGGPMKNNSKHLLDRWILERLNQLIFESVEGFRAYELDRASRVIASFIDDLSVWYIRRSRDRLKGSDKKDKQAALATLRHTLYQLSLILAPSMPFYAEHLYQAVKREDDPVSVHLLSLIHI